MNYTSKFISMLMASAALVACLSTPVLAGPDDTDEAQGYVARVKHSAVQFAAKKVENYALAEIRVQAKKKAGEEINAYMTNSFGGGVTALACALPVQFIANKAIDCTCETAGSKLESMRNTTSSLPPKVKVVLKNYLDDNLTPQIKASKSLVRPAIETYAEKAANYASVGAYVTLSGMTYFVAGYEYAGAVLVAGAIDVIPSLVANKAGYLKNGLKSMFGFDNVVHAAETHVNDMIDTFDSNSVLKLYNIEVTEEDIRKTAEFDAYVNTLSDSFMDSANKALVYGELALQTKAAFRNM